LTFAIVDSDLKHSKTNWTLKILGALELILFSLIFRARIQTKSAIECLDLILTNAKFAAYFFTFKTNIHLHIDELPAATTLVMNVWNLH
jgi:hypothetical protein